jgi:hypothetical protein
MRDFVKEAALALDEDENGIGVLLPNGETHTRFVDLRGERVVVPGDDAALPWKDSAFRGVAVEQGIVEGGRIDALFL